MDLHVHFWDDTDNKVKHFIGILSSWVKLADDVFSKFNDCLSSLDCNKILQVSSDGPNVNIAFLNLVHENRKVDFLDPLLIFGHVSSIPFIVLSKLEKKQLTGILRNCFL